MVFQILIVLTTHIAIPVLFIGWVALGKVESKLNWLATFGLTVSYLILIQLAGAWHWVGVFWPYLFWLVLAGAVVRFIGWRAKGMNMWPTRGVRHWLDFGITTLVLVFLASALPPTVTARSFDGESVDLHWHLPGGAYRVVHGGGSPVLNHHQGVDAQQYAIDVVKTNATGFRARGLWPAQNEAYRIWNVPIIAPCTGEIIGVEKSLPDLTSPDADRDNAAGNYLAIYCNGVTVIVAHLRHGSIKVETGENIEEGEQLARVGNSGNTSEPHLHMHAVRGKVDEYADLMWQGQGVPMILDGKFLVRNDTLPVD